MIQQVVFSNQKVLDEAIYTIFPDQRILTNVRKEAKLQNPKTKLFLELDVWIPDLHICFEFQDMYHYATTWYSHTPLNIIHESDILKNKILHQQKTELILVPFWWDGDPKSLEASIYFKRPDLLSPFTNFPFFPISCNPPSFTAPPFIPGVGDLMLASFPPETSLFISEISLQNSWWLGEKYDGIRFCWHPEHKVAYSRTGLILNFPQVFLDHLAPEFLEGEIWFGRGSFHEAQQIVLSEDLYWDFLRLVTFDVPNPMIRESLFETRYSHLLSSVSSFHPFVIIPTRILCSNANFLLWITKEILNEGGEGTILQKPFSFYLPGRSESLFKFKAMQADGEGLVIGVDDRKITLKLPNGSILETSSSESSEIPKKGDVVTYTYLRHSRQTTPSNPTIYRIRKDVNWEDVVQNFVSDSSDFSGPSRKALGFKQKPTGYWLVEQRKNIRKFLENFANKNNLDPLVAESWYSLAAIDLTQEEGAASLLAHYKGSLVKAIFDLFPEIPNLDESKFSFIPKNYWNSLENRRNLFLEVSRQIGFDPLVANEWYSNYGKLLEQLENHYVLSYYSGSIISAITHIFPEVGFEKQQFYLPPQYWMDEKHRKSFFLKFAAAKGFEPLLSENWYFTKPDHFKATKYGGTVLSFYGGSHVKALLSLFPDIGLQSDKFFKREPDTIYNDESTKQFFVDFASSRKFDALIPDNWYKIKREDIESTKNGRRFIESYGGSHIQALLEVFPNIGLQRLEFKLPSNYWKISKNQKLFFDQFAHSKGFDPLNPEAWYKIRYSDIYSTRHGKSVLGCHGGSYTRALMFCYPDIGLQKDLFDKKKKS